MRSLCAHLHNLSFRAVIMRCAATPATTYYVVLIRYKVEKVQYSAEYSVAG